MGKTTKIIMSLTAGIVAAAGIIAAIFFTSGQEKKPVSDVTVSATQQSTVGDVTVAPTTETTTETTTESTTVQGLATAILGKWTDSANMSGYEFFEDGSVIVTYVNLTIPVINQPIHGESKGVYTLEGNTLTTKFSIYSATIDNTYTVSVENNALSMYDREDGDTATYAKTSSSEATTDNYDESISYADEFIGTWVRSDGKVSYSFRENGLLEATLKGAKVNGYGDEAFTGTYSGVFLTDDNSLIIQYSIGENKVTEVYTFICEKNKLTLTDSAGSSSYFTRKGTSSTQSSPVVSDGILGKWTDGAGMSGYEFKEGGVVEVTYLDITIPVLDMPLKGTFKGTYTMAGDTITISFTAYGNSIVDTYEYEVSGNTLTLLSPDGNMATYIRK